VQTLVPSDDLVHKRSKHCHCAPDDLSQTTLCVFSANTALCPMSPFTAERPGPMAQDAAIHGLLSVSTFPVLCKAKTTSSAPWLKFGVPPHRFAADDVARIAAPFRP
jgi:hypothetical protein